VQPFYNNLVTLTLTGAQLLQVLEQQWAGQPDAAGRVLQVSRGFSYTWDAARPTGQRVLADSLRLNGQPLDPAAVRVTVNGFLASGGDNFTAAEGRAATPHRHDGRRRAGAFVKANPTLAPGPLDRITRLN
jgi:5'-nucleotidase